MKEIFQSKIFWLSSIVFATMFFLVGINYHRSYIGEVEILVLPKNENTIQNINQILANIEEVSASLSFYDNLLENNEEVDDFVPEEVNYEKKSIWNSAFTIFRVRESGIMKIISRSDNPLQAEVLAKGIAKQVAVAMSQYYDIRNDLEVRLVDEPIIHEEDRTVDWRVILASVFLGLACGALFFLAREKQLMKSVPTLRSVMRGEKKTVRAKNTKPVQAGKTLFDQAVQAEKENSVWLDASLENKNFFGPVAQKNAGLPIKNEAPVVSEKIPEQKNYQVVETTIVEKNISTEKKVFTGGNKKASAPDNLPVGEDFILRNLKIVEEKRIATEQQVKEEEKIIAEQKAVNAPKTHEATEEEIKRRLNKLLGGGN